MPRRPRKFVRCPKCRCRVLTLVEVWESTVTAYQRKDGTLWHDGFNLDPGNPTGVIRATCDGCGHQWKLQGWRQLPEGDVEAVQC